MTLNLSSPSPQTLVEQGLDPSKLQHNWPFGNLSPGAFSVIVADPAWSFTTYSAKGHGKSPQRHYSCMPLAEICALPVARLAAPDCALFLWATSPMLPQALEVMQAWGFRYVSSGVWVKTTVNSKIHFGTGYRIRNSHEPFLIGVRGNPKNTRGERSALLARVRAHSQKPEEFYALAERWLPGARRLDMFSRQTRPGWDAWGLEAGKFDGAG